MGFVKRLHRDQSGVVESGLVIIPLIILFLVSMQLIIALNMRNIDMAFTQSRATSIAIGEPPRGNDDVVEFPSGYSRRGITFVVSHMSRQIPNLLIGLMTFIGEPIHRTRVSGIAVMEDAP